MDNIASSKRLVCVLIKIFSFPLRQWQAKIAAEKHAATESRSRHIRVLLDKWHL